MWIAGSVGDGTGAAASCSWERMTYSKEPVTHSSEPLAHCSEPVAHSWEWTVHSKERMIHSFERMTDSKERMIHSFEQMPDFKEGMTRSDAGQRPSLALSPAEVRSRSNASVGVESRIPTARNHSGLRAVLDHCSRPMGLIDGGPDSHRRRSGFKRTILIQ